MCLPHKSIDSVFSISFYSSVVYHWKYSNYVKFLKWIMFSNASYKGAYQCSLQKYYDLVLNLLKLQSSKVEGMTYRNIKLDISTWIFCFMAILMSEDRLIWSLLLLSCSILQPLPCFSCHLMTSSKPRRYPDYLLPFLFPNSCSCSVALTSKMFLKSGDLRLF